MSDSDDLLHHIEQEARDERPDAVAELQAFDDRFRLSVELLRARRASKVSQRELAALSGVQQAEISKIERGQVTPKLTTMNKLLRPLGLRLAIIEDDEHAVA